MSDIESILTFSDAWLRFSVDQPAARRPLNGGAAEELGDFFSFVHIEVVEAEGEIAWQARSGRVVVGDREIAIEEAAGSSRFLRVRVEGGTDEAQEALSHLWRWLREHSRASGPKDINSAGALFLHTIAIVRFPFDFNRLLGPMADAVTAVYDAVNGGPRDEVHYTIRVSIPYSVDANSVRADLRIEKRVRTRLEDRIFWTSSPLDSRRHMEMLEALCSKVGH